MAITKGTVSSNSTVNDSGTTTTLSLTLGSASPGRRLVVHALSTYHDTPQGYASALTVSGNNAVEEMGARALYNVFNIRSQVFSIIEESSSGSTTFQLTYPSALRDVFIICREYTADGDLEIGAVQSKVGSGTTDQTYTLTTTEDNSEIACALAGIAPPATPASGINEDIDQNVNDILYWGGSRSTTTAGGYTVGATTTAFAGFEGAAGSAVEIVEVASATLVDLTGYGLTASLGTLSARGDAAQALTGYGLTSSLGTLTQTFSANVPLTGLEATTSLGTLSAGDLVSVPLTGYGLNANLGTLTQEWDSSVSLTGYGITAALGDLSVLLSGATVLTGYGLTALLGALEQISDATIVLTGLEATVGLGDLSEVWGGSDILTGYALTASLGTLDANVFSAVLLSGFEVTTAVGELSQAFDFEFGLEGMEATASLGSLLIRGAWGPEPAGSEEWTPANPAQNGWIVQPKGGEEWQ